MLPKKERLTKVAFDRSFSLGKRYHSPHFQLIVTSSTQFHGAVVVGKKVYKRAVDRNRLRRQLYATVYRWHKAHPLYSNTYLVITKPSAKTASAATLRAELQTLFETLPTSPL